MAPVGSRSLRWAVVCLSGLFSLASAEQIPICQGDITVTSLPQVTQLISKCETYNGNVVFKDIKVDGAPPEIYLEKLQTVRGSLQFSNLFETSAECKFDFPQLQNVSGQLSFSNLNNVNLATFQALTSVGEFAFNNVTFSPFEDAPPPIFGWKTTDQTGIEDYQFPVLQSITSLNFTGCRRLTGIGPFGPVFGFQTGAEPASVVAVSNEDLASLNLTGYANVHTNLLVTGNDRKLIVLTDATSGFLQIDRVANLIAEDLATLSPAGDGNFSGDQAINNNFFATLNLPALTSIQDTKLEIDDNMYLSALELPVLQSISDLEISDNTKLTTVNLSSVTDVGSLEISGPIKNVILTDLTSSGQIFNQIQINPQDDSVCSNINLPSATELPKSKYTCGPAPVSSTASSTPGSPIQTGNPTSGGGGGMSTGAKAGIGVGAGLGALIIAGLLIYCCMRRNKKRQRSPHSANVGEYYMEPKGTERSPPRYTKVPANSGSVDRSSGERVSPSSPLGANWAPPEQRVPNTDGRVEMEEQQGYRHEMDARSLQDMDFDDDRDETRSLEDIERAHGHR